MGVRQMGLTGLPHSDKKGGPKQTLSTHTSATRDRQQHLLAPTVVQQALFHPLQ